MYAQDFPSEFISTVEASDRHFEIVKPSTMEIQLKVPTLSSPSSILTPSLLTFPTLNPLPPLLATSQSLQHELEFERMFNLWLKVRIWKQTSGNKYSILQVWYSHWAHPRFTKWIGLWNMPPIFHGPDTIEHFNTFPVDGVIRDLQSDAPDVYQLFQTAGNTQRNRRSDQNTYTLED